MFCFAIIFFQVERLFCSYSWLCLVAFDFFSYFISADKDDGKSCSQKMVKSIFFPTFLTHTPAISHQTFSSLFELTLMLRNFHSQRFSSKEENFIEEENEDDSCNCFSVVGFCNLFGLSLIKIYGEKGCKRGQKSIRMLPI